VAKRDGVQGTVALQNATGMLVRFGHQTLEAVSFLVRLDHPNSQPGVIHHGDDRLVTDLGLLRFGHLAVVASCFGCLTVGSERVPHRLGQNLQRHSVLLPLHGGGRMAEQVAGHVDSLARPVDQHHAVDHQVDQAVDGVS
jgi:hypothetical protein